MEKRKFSYPVDEITLEHAPTVAVCVVEGLDVIPFKKTDGKIAWLIRGDASKALDAIYQNKKIGINDYLKALSSVRASIFTLKAMK